MAEDYVDLLRAAEQAYPGGDLATHGDLAQRHGMLVARWIGRMAGAFAPVTGHQASNQHPQQTLVLGTRESVRAAKAPVLLRDGGGVILVPQNEVIVALDYPLYTSAGLTRVMGTTALHPLNPLVTLRWSLTDLLLRRDTSTAPVTLTVVDDAGIPVLAPYARGFALGSGALYGRSYHYGQPMVNVGFDAVALKALAAALSTQQGLSYRADVSTMKLFAPFLQPLRQLLAANGIEPMQWLALYHSSNVLNAIFMLIRRSHRNFGQDPDPSHIGSNIDRNAYGYALMKAVSRHDSGAVGRILADFKIPAIAKVPVFSVA